MDLVWPFLIPITAIICVFTLAIVKALAQSRIRELEVRERIAMIERGLVPAPEADPRGFERAMGRLDRVQGAPRAERLRGGGIVLIGVGLGLTLLLSLTADLRVGLGVGGFLVILGAAVFVSATLHRGPSPPLADLSPAPRSQAVPPSDQNE